MTNNIEITHNPFIVETHFVFNGQTPAENCRLSSYKESRLQLWIEKLFDELKVEFNGDTNFTVAFRGAESDYLDVLEAAKVAKDNGMTVDVTWIEAQPVETRLEQIQQLMNEALEHPKFGTYLREDDEISRSFKDAFNRDFDVYVVATMSAGKSTLINAMLGCDLLPARNEATTATIARITDNGQMVGRFSAKRVDKNENAIDSTEEATLQTIEEWNTLNDTLRIDIEGSILAIKERDSVRLVLTDTPGPNNSQNNDHQRTTMGFIQDSTRNPLILYVLNASQLATTDDRNLLGLVAEIMNKGGKQSKDRFVFVINKMDVFDPEMGEDPKSVLIRVHKYLTDNGIHNPLIYPVSANLTRLIRKPSDLQTRKERGDFSAMADLFEEPSMNLLKYMPITSRVKRALESKQYTSLMLNSGLPAVEAMIDEYIDKYNLPHRVKRAYDALNKAIEKALNQTHLIEQLDQDERALMHINDELQILSKRREKGFDATAYKDKVEREGKALPKITEDALHRLGTENKTLFEKIEGEFKEKSVTVEKAKKIAQDAENDLTFHFKKLINEYESKSNESRNAITQDLKAEYQRYVRELFPDSEHLELPILDEIRQSLTNIPLNLIVQQENIQSRKVKTGSNEVSDSTWYKPWTYFSTRTVYDYKNEEYVDLAEFWVGRGAEIKAEFEQLTKDARYKITIDKDALIEHYLAFMNQEFDIKFNELLDSIKNKLTDRKAREQAIEESRQLLNWINKFKSKLDKTLSV